MLKGNHDYWWNSLTKLNEYIEENSFEGIKFLHNNSYEVEGKIIVGTRGWNLFGEEADEKILARELIRLELSIKSGIETYGKDKEIIACLHFPPTNKDILENSKFIQLMKKYNVKKCIYGHLHGEAKLEAVEGELEGIDLKLVSADYLKFKLYKVS
jgi:predicted phosphohydrolase